jgi:hypothetical protein
VGHMSALGRALPKRGASSRSAVRRFADLDIGQSERSLWVGKEPPCQSALRVRASAQTTGASIARTAGAASASRGMA